MNRRDSRILISIIALIVLLLLSIYSRYQEGKHLSESAVRVIEVHDGDTISVILNGNREKIRLIGIDAPEIGQRPWGQRAKKHLKDLLSDSKWTVSLEFDVEKRDKYGRLLSYVRSSNGSMINVEMVRDGYAMLYTIPPNIRYIDELRKTQYEARLQGLGIWGSKGLKETPYEYRKEHPRL